MATPEVPHSVPREPPGCMLIEPTASEVQVFVYMTKWGASDLPRRCNVDIQLASWDVPPVLAIAFLLRLARSEVWTYQAWINGGNGQGIRALLGLARRDHLRVRVVTDRVERSLRTYNVVRREALSLARRITPRRRTWSQKLFDETRQRIDTLYPTAARLWHAGRETRRRRVRR